MRGVLDLQLIPRRLPGAPASMRTQQATKRGGFHEKETPMRPTNSLRRKPRRTGAAALGIAAGALALAQLPALSLTQASASSSSKATSSATTRSTTAARGASRPVPGAPGPGRGGPKGPGKHGLDGSVSNLQSSSFTLLARDGTRHTVTLSSSTTYNRGPATTASRSALADGEHVKVRPTGTPAAPGSNASVQAADVSIIAPHMDGVISAIGGSTVTITDPDGFTRTIKTSSSTTYTHNGQSSSRSVLANGQNVHAVGSVDSDHTDLDAASVNTGTPPPPTPPQG